MNKIKCIAVVLLAGILLCVTTGCDEDETELAGNAINKGIAAAQEALNNAPDGKQVASAAADVIEGLEQFVDEYMQTSEETK